MGSLFNKPNKLNFWVLILSWGTLERTTRCAILRDKNAFQSIQEIFRLVVALDVQLLDVQFLAGWAAAAAAAAAAA